MNEALLLAVADSDDVLFPLVRAGHRVPLWYRSDEFVGTAQDCRVATYQLGRPLFAMNYGGRNVHYWDPEASSEMPKRMIDELVPGQDVLAIITNDGGYLSRTLGRLQRRNPEWHESAKYMVGGHDIAMGLHLLSAAP